MEKEQSKTEEKEEKMTAEEIKLMKALETGKLEEEKLVHEAIQISDKSKYSWYLKNLYDIDPSLGLVLKDYDLLAKHRKAIFQLIKQVGVNLLKGKSIMNISLPISIMEPLSTLQRMAVSYGYLPSFVERILATKDPVERLKHFLSMKIADMHITLVQRKPLNPVLGETYQGYLGDEKYKVYCEQIEHHPPISSMMIACPALSLYVTQDYEARTYPNTLKVKYVGTERVHFNDIAHTQYVIKEFPILVVGGSVIGRRTMIYEGNLTIKDKTNKIYVQARFNPEKQGFFERVFNKTEKHRSDFFKGFITCRKELLKDDSRKAFYSKDMISYFEGNWLENIKIDGDMYWEVGNDKVYELVTAPGCLESDSTKRPDLQALAAGKEEDAQRLKEEIEDAQRNDRKLRADAQKHKK